MSDPALESSLENIEGCTEPVLLKLLNLTDDLIIDVGKDLGAAKKIKIIYVNIKNNYI